MHVSYKDQFALLAESMEREKQDLSVRERAQAKVCRLQSYKCTARILFIFTVCYKV